MNLDLQDKIPSDQYDDSIDDGNTNSDDDYSKLKPKSGKYNDGMKSNKTHSRDKKLEGSPSGKPLSTLTMEELVDKYKELSRAWDYACDTNSCTLDDLEIGKQFEKVKKLMKLRKLTDQAYTDSFVPTSPQDMKRLKGFLQEELTNLPNTISEQPKKLFLQERLKALDISGDVNADSYIISTCTYPIKPTQAKSAPIAPAYGRSQK